MRKRQHIFSSGRRPQIVLAAGLVVFLLAFPVRGFAQCESNGTALAEEAVVQGEQDNLIDKLTHDSFNPATVGRNELGWVADLQPMRATLDKVNRDTVLTNLNTWWSRWSSAWHGIGQQFSAGILDQSRQLGSITDAANEENAALDEEQERVKSGLNNQPSDQTCRFDTAAYSLAPARSLSDAVAEGYEGDFTAFGNNEKAAEKEQSIAQYGPAQMQDQRWNAYQQNFCDYLAENGNAGCSGQYGPDPLPPNYVAPAPPGPMQQYADWNVRPTQILFAQDTINMYSSTELLATNDLIFNVTGYKIPDPILKGALGSLAGVEHTLDRRRYMAQMDAAGALLYSLIGDRAPAPAPPEDFCISPSDGRAGSCTYALRQYYGVFPFTQQCKKWMGGECWITQDIPPPLLLTANIDPSLREIRQSIVEQLWDPNFYKNLLDNPSTVAQKEVYLKAYSLLMLYDMISKQEKISDAYAVETANILRHSAKILTSSSENIPFQ